MSRPGLSHPLTVVSTPVTLTSMNDPTLAQSPSLSHIAHVRRRELRTLARNLQDAEIKVTLARDKLDRCLFRWRQDGSSITDLSLASGISRETVYRSIRRVQRDLDADKGSKKGR